jgi:signal transduction histidine kinase
MLGLARPRADRRAATDLVRLAREVILLAGKDLQKHRVQIEFGAEGRPHARVNPAQIQQVLLNLLINARQAMPQGGTVRVRVGVDPSGRLAALSVADTGVGIAPQDLRRIFEPFFTTKEPAQGSGLGLSMVYGIVKQMNGHITVDSAVNQGTTFRLYLPAIEGSAGDGTRQTATARPDAARATEVAAGADD